MSLFYSAGLGGSAIPDDGVNQFIASETFDGSEGSITAWSALRGNDASGSGEIVSSGVNANVSVRIDETNDGWTVDSPTTLSAPITVISVVDLNSTQSGDVYVGGSNVPFLTWDDTNWLVGESGAPNVSGSTDDAVQLLTVIFRSGSIVLRENGVETVNNSDTSYGQGHSGMDFGDGAIRGKLDADLGVSWRFDRDLEASGDLTDYEQSVADLYGITL